MFLLKFHGIEDIQKGSNMGMLFRCGIATSLKFWLISVSFKIFIADFPKGLTGVGKDVMCVCPILRRVLCDLNIVTVLCISTGVNVHYATCSLFHFFSSIC